MALSSQGLVLDCWNNYNLSASIGDIDVFGKEYDGSGAVENSTSAKYKLTITTDVGDIDVEWGNISNWMSIELQLKI